MARVIVNSADCAIGRDAARLVLDGVQGFRDDYEEHILRHRCLGGMREPVPCVALCPAGVDIPGYLVLIKYGRYADAVRLIRKDNPIPLGLRVHLRASVRGALPKKHDRRRGQHPRPQALRGG